MSERQEKPLVDNTRQSTDVAPVEAKRIKSFALFFKSYMSVSSVLLAALPIPVTAFKVLPVFEAQRAILSVYTPLFCFLLVSYFFFSRHSLARWMFPLVKNTKERRIRAIVPFLPLAFIAATALSIVMYHVTLNSSIKSLQHEFRDIAYHTLTSTGGVDPNDNRLSAGVLGITGHVDYDILEGLTVFSPTTLLKGIRFNKIPLGGVLIAFYIGIFIFAEAAFLTMAMKEYLQDVLQLSDQDLIRRKA